MSATVQRVADEVHPQIAEALVEVFTDPSDRDFAADLLLIVYQAGIGRGRFEALLDVRRRAARYPDSEERP